MTNFDLWKLVNFITGKDIYSKRLSGPQMELELQSKNISLLRKRLGFPEAYQQGQPPVAIDSIRLTQTDLKPFYVEKNINVSQDGIALIPEYFYIEDFYTAESLAPEIISRAEISNRIRDVQTKPTVKYPVAYIISKGLQVYPVNIGSIHVIYIRKPVEPKFSIKTNTTTLEYEYDVQNSVELEWDDMGKLDILQMILSEFGLSIERNDIVNIAKQVIKTGD